MNLKKQKNPNETKQNQNNPDGFINNPDNPSGFIDNPSGYQNNPDGFFKNPPKPKKPDKDKDKEKDNDKEKDKDKCGYASAIPSKQEIADYITTLQSNNQLDDVVLQRLLKSWYSKNFVENGKPIPWKILIAEAII